MSDSVIVAAKTIVKKLQTIFSAVSDGSLSSPLFAAPFVQRQQDAGVLASPPTTLAATAVLSPPATVTALPSAVFTAQGTTAPNPLVPVLKSSAWARADQGFCLRWRIPGLDAAGYQVVGTFHFGQYALAIGGDGRACLWEDVKYVAWQTAAAAGHGGDVSPSWQKRFPFRYCRPNQVAGGYHSLILFPVLGPNGEKYICFASANLDATQIGAAGVPSVPGGTMPDRSGATSGTEAFFRWDESVTNSSDQAGASHVTVAAQFWLTEPYDLRAEWQVSKLGFWASGTLVDQPWPGTFTHPVADYLYTPVQKVPPTVTLPFDILPTLADATTASTTNIRDPYVSWRFDGDSTDTPVLWGYRLIRQPVIIQNNPGPFNAPFIDLTLNGAAQDPRVEQGSIRHKDAADALTRLKTRGELTGRVAVNAPTSEGAKDIVLMRGYTVSPHRGRRTGFGPGPFPATDWGDYSAVLVGMWRRLTETNTRSVLSWEVFALDPSSAPNANGYYGPWKITDAIKYLLTSCGFPAGMLNIPDLPIRFAPGIAAGGSNLIKDSHTDVASMVQTLCRQYLGRWLVFDPNAGALQTDGYPIGQWTLVGAPPAGAVTPIYHFVAGPSAAAIGPQTSGVFVPPHMPAAFPANTTGAITSPGDPGYYTYTVPPDYNHLWALYLSDAANSGGVQISNHVYNYLSYAVPGSTVTLDPSSPHYVGRERFAVISDPSLWVGAQAGGYHDGQWIVNYVLHRYFYYACLARQVVTFAAPLVFIKDAATTRWRPLRFYDPVTWQGQPGWFVRSVSPHIPSDRMQTATYELEKVVPYLTS